MHDDERVYAVKELLFDYVKSPSLRHIRDPFSVVKLAQEIVKRIDRRNALWQKWDDQRERLVKSALPCWIPTSDLRDYLNTMQGPKLTIGDVEGRLRAPEEDAFDFAREELREGCLAVYDKEKAQGTELSAIVQLIRGYVEREEERLATEQRENWEKQREADRLAREQRLLSGADCKWTQLRGSKSWYCRMNARTYRLSPTSDKRWNLERVNAVSDEERGTPVGKYQGRGDATKALAQVAYQPEFR